jgi:8-oxo-dGTP pyrophosphatase MutT (NUDIX family)
MYMDFKERIKAALSARKRVTMAPGPVPSAVLMPVFLKDGEYHILFTKRTENLNHHRGEISFPGGVRHAWDRDALQTALRETWEEVGILPEDVEVLGCLDDFFSIHNYLITPFVGMIPGNYEYRINSGEIERMIEVPVSHFLQPGVFRVEDWSWKGRTRPVYFYTYRGDDIWGVTGAILKQFLDLVFLREEVERR